MNESENLYAQPYTVLDGCLCMQKITKQGETYIPLCNFAPRIICESAGTQAEDALRMKNTLLEMMK